MTHLVLALLIALSAMSATAAEKEYPPWFDPKTNVLSPDALRILETGELTLLSLYPYLPSPADQRHPSRLFHGFKILGKTKLPKSSERAELLRTLQDGISASDGVAAQCFDPRHGVHAILSGQSVDLVICFACLRIRVYSSDESHILTTRLPQPAFDRALKKARLPIAKAD